MNGDAVFRIYVSIRVVLCIRFYTCGTIYTYIYVWHCIYINTCGTIYTYIYVWYYIYVHIRVVLS